VDTEFVVIFTAGIAVALASAFTFLTTRKRRFEPVEVAWKKYAAERGMSFVSTPGWSRATMVTGFPPAIEGEIQGVPVKVLVDYAWGSAMYPRGTPLTRVEAALPTISDDFLFAIYRRSALSRVGSELRDVKETITGNKAFDAVFALFSNDSDLARSILDRRLAQVIGDFPRESSYVYARGTRFALTWPEVETNPEILDAAVQLVWTACRRRA
jgi:hypothetical protein